MSGSVRTGSLNTTLINAAGDIAVAAGHDVDALDLGTFHLPLYDGDIEQTHGVPVAATELASRVAQADAVLIASPEYNGGPSGLLKNSIDWATRAEMTVFAGKPIGLLCATPGSKGGMVGIGVMTSIFTHMMLDLHGEPFSLAKAYDALEDGALNATESARLGAWLADVLAPLTTDESDRSDRSGQAE